MNSLYTRIRHQAVRAQFRAFASLKRYVIEKLFEIELFALIVFTLRLYEYIPYINLIISPLVYYLAVVLIGIRLFSITVKQLLLCTYVLFTIMSVLAIKHYDSAVETIANFVYFLLCYIIFIKISELRSRS